VRLVHTTTTSETLKLPKGSSGVRTK
jgi:hypothetical protein